MMTLAKTEFMKFELVFSQTKTMAYIILLLLNQMLVIQDKSPENEMKMFPKHLMMTISTSGPHREMQLPCY